MSFSILVITLAIAGYWGSRGLSKHVGASFLERVASLSLIITGASCIAFPLSTAQPLAELFGIGRGVDFVFYVYIIFSLIMLNVLYKKAKLNNYRLTILMSELAQIQQKMQEND